jgi:hypothetical protein
MVTQRNRAPIQTKLEVGPPLGPEEFIEFRDRSQQYRSDRVELSRLRDELVQTHDEEWVAMHNGRLFFAKDEAEMVDGLRAQGIDPGRTVIRYLSRQRRLDMHL